MGAASSRTKEGIAMSDMTRARGGNVQQPGRQQAPARGIAFAMLLGLIVAAIVSLYAVVGGETTHDAVAPGNQIATGVPGS
jgi:hypothetical protein